MTIDWFNFTPWSALIGGGLIGLSVVTLMVFNGRIAGISGIFSSLWHGMSRQHYWRVAFILGLLMSFSLLRLCLPLTPVSIDIPVPLLLLAGFLVGLGSRCASGCTSGHGVCGLARFSLRSLVATLVFMSTAFIVVYMTRHGIG